VNIVIVAVDNSSFMVKLLVHPIE